jgi:hypothetical protein
LPEGRIGATATESILRDGARSSDMALEMAGRVRGVAGVHYTLNPLRDRPDRGAQLHGRVGL